MDGDKLVKFLDEKIDTIFDEERYKKFLESTGRFHQYSFSNQILILLQKPDAFRVAGYNTWIKKFNRHVKKGEKGIGILAPKMVNIYVVKAENRPLKYNEMTKDELKKAVEAGLVEKRRGKRGFMGVTVFDISQTEGQDLDANTDGLKGSYRDLDKIFKSITKASGAEVVRSKEIFSLDIFGYFSRDTNKIVVRDLQDIQVAKTALHECSHSLAKRIQEDGEMYTGEYRGWITDGTKMMELSHDDEEVIVESSSYVIMNQLGIDTSDYSFNYIMNWATAYRSTEEGKQRFHLLFGYIGKIVDKILTALETEFNINTDESAEEDNDTIKEELAEELLTTMEANAARVKLNGGAVV